MCENVTCINYSTGKSALPDIYARGHRVAEDECMYTVVSRVLATPRFE